MDPPPHVPLCAFSFPLPSTTRHGSSHFTEDKSEHQKGYTAYLGSHSLKMPDQGSAWSCDSLCFVLENSYCLLATSHLPTFFLLPGAYFILYRAHTRSIRPLSCRNSAECFHCRNFVGSSLCSAGTPPFYHHPASLTF